MQIVLFSSSHLKKVTHVLRLPKRLSIVPIVIIAFCSMSNANAEDTVIAKSEVLRLIERYRLLG